MVVLFCTGIVLAH